MCLDKAGMKTIKNSIGICVGAATVSLVLLEWPQFPLLQSEKPDLQFWSRAHEGNPKQTLGSILKTLPIDHCNHIAVTGRKFRYFLNLSTISESEAVEYAYRFSSPENISCSAIVSAGGETFMAYLLDKVGNISNVITGNKCASGTGEFFLQQLKRMDIPLEEINHYRDEIPFKVSGRCSVFCKSDCTHATNNGIPKGSVTDGLCRMMAEKILELLKGVDKKNIMLTGGTTKNHKMVHYLKKDIEGLIIPKGAVFFEALGCALFAMENQTIPFIGLKDLFKSEKNRFQTLPQLKNAGDLVTYMSLERARIKKKDICILGLDVGSTTTKAVLIRDSDNRILETVYLRTNGDPVNASINCYQAMLSQIREKTDPASVRIKGIGICGSGRRVAGLHAFSEGVINELTAHAFSALFFDPSVDTIFEIGGQDAKYTLITGGVPSEYAMNEACSAGTGSFLEESASETLGVRMEDIAEAAFKGETPLNFSDQCAAFIGSDIKNAVQCGMSQENILSGLVYSVCQNYLNRVKGRRPVGKKIFMQGGVCYNHAVPMAMASLLKKTVVVPPFPGLMGAFGAALVIKERIDKQILPAGYFDLKVLISRRLNYLSPFKCSGKKGLCDRGCRISLIEIENIKLPFGGACDKYYNQHFRSGKSVVAENYVDLRQNLVFQKQIPAPLERDRVKEKKTVGINRSFLVNTFYPLYVTFFTQMGFCVEIPEKPAPNGTFKMETAFCFPAELSHYYFHSLLGRKGRLDYIFLPHFKAVPDIGSQSHAQLCPFVQAEPYYLKTAFNDDLHLLDKYGTKLVTSVLDMTKGIQDAEKSLVETALKMGEKKKRALHAFKRAVEVQVNCFSEMKKLGSRFLNSLDLNPDNPGIVIFGRSYNSLTPEANKGIPDKIASRGVPVISVDCLPIENEIEKQGLYWGSGQQIYMGAQFVKRHPQLFGVLITNFSCGPDSFIISYFRDVMGKKPSLTLELDSHTADAGLETRIEAFLDIISMPGRSKPLAEKKENIFIPAKILYKNNRLTFSTSANKPIPLKTPEVEVVIPSMGKYPSEAMAAVLRSLGFNARSQPPANEEILKLGKSHTLGKECLPMILVTGMLLDSIQKKKPDKKLVFFLATASGPCRLGQYEVYLKELIKKEKIPDVAILPLSSDGSYSGFGKNFQKRMWVGTLISDAMEDIRSIVLANTEDVNGGIQILEQEWNRIINALESGNVNDLMTIIAGSAVKFRTIPMKKPLDHVPVISLVGEIFVRRDSFSRRFLTERLAQMGFAVRCAPVSEWFFYIDLMLSKGFLKKKLSKIEMVEAMYRKNFMARYENIIQSIFKTSGLYHGHPVNVQSIVEHALPFIPLDLAGEGILTVGSALMNMISNACGVIAIGPFGCMPNRISEAILNKTMNQRQQVKMAPGNQELKYILSNMDHLPFLTIESDGRPFPQVVEAKLETFLLRAGRLHSRMLEISGNASKMDHSIQKQSDDSIRIPLLRD